LAESHWYHTRRYTLRTLFCNIWMARTNFKRLKLITELGKLHIIIRSQTIYRVILLLRASHITAHTYLLPSTGSLSVAQLRTRTDCLRCRSKSVHTPTHRVMLLAPTYGWRTHRGSLFRLYKLRYYIVRSYRRNQRLYNNSTWPPFGLG